MTRPELIDCRCTMYAECEKHSAMREAGEHELSEDCWCDPKVIHVNAKNTKLDSFPAKRGRTP